MEFIFASYRFRPFLPPAMAVAVGVPPASAAASSPLAIIYPLGVALATRTPRYWQAGGLPYRALNKCLMTWACGRVRTRAE